MLHLIVCFATINFGFACIVCMFELMQFAELLIEICWCGFSLVLFIWLGVICCVCFCDGFVEDFIVCLD